MTDKQATVAVIGAGGKMGQRISNNLDRSDYPVLYAENSPKGRDYITGLGRELTESHEAAAQADVVILAVPDVLLGRISADIVPTMKPGAILLTLDPAAAYANLLYQRDGIAYAVAHPCHPSVFLERKTKEEYADTFGGIAAPQDVVAAFEHGDEARALTRGMRGALRLRTGRRRALGDRQAARRRSSRPWSRPSACMIGALLKEALAETVHTVGVPEPAARAMLLGHIQVALANTLRGSNPFSDACLIAMDYGRETIVKDDWKKIFDDTELDKVLARMLHLDAIDRTPA